MGVSFQKRKLRSADAAYHLSKSGWIVTRSLCHGTEESEISREGPPAASPGSFFYHPAAIRFVFEKRPPCSTFNPFGFCKILTGNY